ncbi:anti-sigma factor [Amycolatopsis sp. NPDC054798]
MITATAPVVELRFPANGGLLFLASLVAEDVAASAEFTFDEVADFRLAVDEAVAAQARRADDGAVLECAFRCGGRLTVTVATTSSWAFPPGPDDVGWHVLRALTDSLDAWTEPAPGAGGWRLCLEFSREPFPEEPRTG